jgi:hypothetical protein
MNQEIYAILKEMKQKENEGPIGSSEYRIQKALSIRMACLFVRLGEEAEAWSKKAEQQTDKVIGLTKGLRILSYVLVAVGLIQIGLMLKNLF